MTLFTFIAQGQIIPDPVGYDLRNADIRAIKVANPTSSITTLEKSGVQLVIPIGWKSIGLDSTYYNFSNNFTMTALCNKNGDEVYVWCDRSVTTGVTTEQMIEADLSQFAPLHEHIKTIIIESLKGQDVKIYIWRAFHIHNGKKEAFTIFAAYKSQIKFGPEWGTARLFGRSASLDTEGKTEIDIIKMAEYLQPFGKAAFATKEGIEAMKEDFTRKFHLKWNKYLDSLQRLTLNIEQKKQDSPSTWQVYLPADPKKVCSEARLISPHHLFLIYVSGVGMINTQTRALLWFHPGDYQDWTVVTGSGEQVITCSNGTNSVSMKAFETVSGKEQWSATLEGEVPTGWLTNDDSGVLISVQQGKNNTQLTALDIKTGKKRWGKSNKHNADLDNPPFPVLAVDNLITFCDGIEAISPSKGVIIWRDVNLRLDDNCPIPKINMDTIIVLDKSNTLCWMDAKTGQRIQTVKVSTSVEYTNIFSGQGRIYLRGRNKNSRGPQIYFIDAIKNNSGENLWRYSDSIITVSNLIDDGQKVYASTWKGPFALNWKSGVLLFMTDVSEVGRTYPVSIWKYGDTIVYVGEMVIAGVDGSTGAILFKQAFDPVSQTDNLDAIDQQCKRLSDYLRHYGKAGQQGVSLEFGSSDYFFSLARSSQERSTSLAKVSEQSYSQYKSGGTTGDYYDSEIAGFQSRIESGFVKSQMQVGMILWAIESANKRVAKFTELERTRLRNLINSRYRLMELYKKQQPVGEYLTKIVREGDSLGVAVVHLPSGTVIHILRNVSKDNIILNPEQNELYYHELGLVPELQKNNDNVSDGTVAYGTYLVSIPLRIHN